VGPARLGIHGQALAAPFYPRVDLLDRLDPGPAVAIPD